MRIFIYPAICGLLLISLIGSYPNCVRAGEAGDIKNTNKSLPSYLDPLLKASQVSNRFQGRGGESKEFKLFERALKDSSLSIRALNSARDKATPAGQIYIAMIMMKHYPKQAKSNLKSMLKDSTKFNFKEGCLVHTYTVKKAANELLTRGSLLSVNPTKL